MHDHKDINITEHDKEAIEGIVSDLSIYIRPVEEEGQTEDIFDNKTLDLFMKSLIVILNDIKNEGNISKHVHRLNIEVN